MSANANLISCNFTSPVFVSPKTPRKPISSNSPPPSRILKKSLPLAGFPRTSSLTNVSDYNFRTVGWWSLVHHCQKRGFPVCYSVLDSKESEKETAGLKTETNLIEGARDWTTSILLLVFYGALMYYVFNLAPNQTPNSDFYFLQKLLNLKGDDEFRMNDVLVSIWYIMGLYPLVYSMLLLPTARSTKSKIPVWPFCVLSFFGGAYALVPYFVFWRPPPPPIDESELEKWPLNFLESKLTAGISLAAGLGLIIYAVLAGSDSWTEFYRYFRSSKFIHVMSLDFSLLSTFAPFWVYNDMTARKWYDKGSWLLPVSLVPLIGPALYLILRPPLSELPRSSEDS